MQENTENEKAKFFDRLILNELSMAEAVEEGKRYGMNLSAPCYAVCLFKILMSTDDKMILEQIVRASEKIEEEADRTDALYLFRRGISGWAFLLLAEDEEQMKERMKKRFR